MSTACLYPVDTEVSLAKAGELGFRKVELFLNTDGETQRGYLSRLGKICGHYGIEVVSVHLYTAAFESMMFFSAYERRTADSINKYVRYFDAIKKLSPKYLTFHGERSAVSGLHFDQLPFSRIKEVYHKLCAAAKPYGIKISQENVAWCRSKSPEYLKKLREEVPELYFTLDIKQAIRAGLRPEEYLSAMGDALSNIHMCDYNSFESCLLPGRGEMNYYKFFELLRENKYKNDIIIEVYSSNFLTETDIIESGEFLKGIINCQN